MTLPIYSNAALKARCDAIVPPFYPGASESDRRLIYLKDILKLSYNDIQTKYAAEFGYLNGNSVRGRLKRAKDKAAKNGSSPSGSGGQATTSNTVSPTNVSSATEKEESPSPAPEDNQANDRDARSPTAGRDEMETQETRFRWPARYQAAVDAVLRRQSSAEAYRTLVDDLARRRSLYAYCDACVECVKCNEYYECVECRKCGCMECIQCVEYREYVQWNRDRRREEMRNLANRLREA